MAFLAPYLVACVLLVVAGRAKLLRPLNTARALEQVTGIRESPNTIGVARAGGVLEVLLGSAAAVFPYAPLAVAVCVVYAGFALFLFRLRIRGGPLAVCGCFSSIEAHPTRTHVVIDIALAACAGSVAAAGSGAWLPTLLARSPLDGVPLLAACVVCTWLVVLTLTALPGLSDARTMLEESSAAG